MSSTYCLKKMKDEETLIALDWHHDQHKSMRKETSTIMN